MSFAWHIEHWEDVQAFREHLARHNPRQTNAWTTHLTLHHTWKPTTADWKQHGGQHYMQSLGRYYRSLGWSAGPHLFVAPDGIWQGTPLNLPGIHAREPANACSIGIEVVGNYDREGWLLDTSDTIYGVLVALCRWLDLPPDRVKGHREWTYDKSCPGWAIDMGDVRQRLAVKLAGQVVVDDKREQEKVTTDTPILGTTEITPEHAAEVLARVYAPSHATHYSCLELGIIAATYWTVCEAVGTNPLVAFAQMLHETDFLRSWWAMRPRRNPAGLGVTGETRATPPPPAQKDRWALDGEMWLRGITFPGWHLAIRAHVGRLLAYALTDDEATTDQRVLIQYALSLRSLPVSYRGISPTLDGLTGRWAADGQYAAKIARVANEVIP